ncbi:hypothetical protein LOK49_LG02G00400 [Camellia lanceoleosa]|uniref:Uncharacterized protein n=1 Tax=Camellia lanceoleosa TaxID=1840588 RepID=A0ACC0IMP0_9ERIC|nr:hypothetical protein LOK49_LG02G00400 [Camellia lanceoleosa]
MTNEPTATKIKYEHFHVIEHKSVYITNFQFYV